MADFTTSTIFLFLLTLLIVQLSAMAVLPSSAGTCPPGSLMCLDGSQCYSASLRCDGNEDCADTTDEFGCEGAENVEGNNITCPDGSLLCKSGDQCFEMHQRCDQEKNCVDGSDEYNCPVECEGEHLFSCTNGNCISSDLKCNENDDCGDYSDEMGCGPPVDMNCTSEEFVCPDGTCLSPTRVCDGVINCMGGSDEKGPCPPPESSRESTASSETETSTLDIKSENDIQQQSDISSIAPHLTTLSNSTNFNATRYPNGCKDYEFPCNDGTCIHLFQACDTQVHCPDGSDEGEGCVQQEDCGDDFRCASGTCLERKFVCNGIHDCFDGTDEEYCNNNPSGSSGVIYYPNEPKNRTKKDIQTDRLLELQLEIANQERFNQDNLYRLKVKELEYRNAAAKVELKAAQAWRDVMVERLQQQRKQHHLSLAALQGTELEPATNKSEIEVSSQNATSSEAPLW